MKIKKILNNNAIISENDQTEEIIITGKGIAFGKKAGDLIDSRWIFRLLHVCWNCVPDDMEQCSG